MELNTKAYPCSLTEGEWELIMPHLPVPCGRGRRPQHCWREILDGVFYLTRTGCQWRNLPHDFPKWQTVYYHFTKLEFAHFLVTDNRLVELSQFLTQEFLNMRL